MSTIWLWRSHPSTTIAEKSWLKPSLQISEFVMNSYFLNISSTGKIYWT
ncbi:MAG: hypothetical protein ICV78_07445 [Tolypothrix sp. Co-bin9]|nr:hypothetical protein [Tolypothrix sp. Co-bin9]